MRLIDADALLNGFDVHWVTEYDEAGLSMEYNAVPVGAIENAPTIDAMPKWISVEERLPGAKGPYLVCGEHWIAGAKTITTICFWWGDRWDRDGVFEITHWMPLPEPPKEEE